MKKMKNNSYKKIFKKARKERIDLFNERWLKNTGYKFTEDDKFKKAEYKKKLKDWKKERDAIFKKYGVTLERYEWLCDNWYESETGYGQFTMDNLPKPFTKENFDEINKVMNEEPTKDMSLYYYEKYVMDEAERLAIFIMEHGGKEIYVPKIADKDIFDIKKNMEADSFKFDEGHSANSLGTAIGFAWCLLTKPEAYKYLHGALVSLVGDKGYYDDRVEANEYFKVK